MNGRVLLYSDATQRRHPRTILAAMPPAKRQKKSAAPQPRNVPPEVEPVAEEGSEFARLAKQHWLKSSKKTSRAKVKVKNDVLKQSIWDPLERDKFPFSSLLELESLQTLERSALPCCPPFAIANQFAQLSLAWL